MIEESLRKFCESPHRWLIVIAGTFIVGLVLVIPLVDVYSAERDERSSLLTELGAAKHATTELKRFEVRVTEKLAEMKVIEARTVDEQTLPALRDTLVELAKETECSIRRLSVGSASSRAWTVGDDPVSLKSDAKKGESETGFMLQWRPISVSLSGTSANLRSLLDRIADEGMLMHTKSLEIYPASPNRQSLTLDMELWFYTLSRRGYRLHSSVL